MPNKSTDTQCTKRWRETRPVKDPPVTPDRFFRAFDNGIANGFRSALIRTAAGGAGGRRLLMPGITAFVPDCRTVSAVAFIRSQDAVYTAVDENDGEW
jgi:hypothetical protein